jgi:aspartate aminotransferase-like enzyme
MLWAGAILLILALGIAAYGVRERRLREETANSVRAAGLAMLCEKARQESSVELKAKLSSGVLRGAFKEAAEVILRERGDA